MPLMGYREYARHRDCALQSVQKAIADGRITTELDDRGKQKINSEVADASWLRNTDAGRQSLLNSQGPAVVVSATTPIFPPLDVDQVDLPLDSDGEQPAAAPAGQETAEYRVARTSREQLRLEKERMELDELRGRLVNVEEASRAAFTAFRTLRDRVLNVPTRVKHQLAAEADAERIERMLDDELSAALTFDEKNVLVERDIDDEDEDGEA